MKMTRQNSPVLEARCLKKGYGAKPALDGVDLVLPRGQIIGLLGPNGSGKTTLIKLACGLLQPSAGELLINGMKPGVETKKVVSYLPERSYLPNWIRVRDALDQFEDYYSDFNREKAMDMLKRLRLEPQMRISEMSKGTREKIQLILVMSREADLYLLDEPIGGVDPAARDYILETIIAGYRENATLVISTHLIADVEKILDGLVFLKEGRIAQVSSVEEIRENEGKSVDALFREVFRC